MEQLNGFSGLVRLEPADAMQAHFRVTGEQRRPFGQRLLNPAFAEITLAGGNQFFDLLSRARLADGNQLHISRLAPSRPGRGSNLIENFLSALGSIHDWRL